MSASVENIIALNGLTSAPTPPAYNSGNGYGVVPRSWMGGGVEEFDVEVFADGTSAVTVAKLVRAIPEKLISAIADQTMGAISGASITITSHALVHGDGPFQLTTTGALPSPLKVSTNYWIIYVDANTVKLAESLDKALKGVAITLSGGSGTNKITTVAAPTPAELNNDAPTKRLKWFSCGFLGEAADGAISNTAAMGWAGRVEHCPAAVAYSLVATIGSSIATTVLLRPFFRQGPRAGY